MTWGRRRRAGGPVDARSPRRRSGPAGEAPWWDRADQELAERPLLVAGDFGRGWTDVAMPNNAEQLDPLGDDPDSEAVRHARAERRLTALDEGRAWRQRTVGSLAVVRLEVFADADEVGHRAAWRDHAEASLGGTWRARWTERDLRPGWIEARWVEPDTRQEPLIDWLRIEDHTDHTDAGRVTVYEHFTIWAGRPHVTLIVRHDLDVETNDVGVAVAATILTRLTTPA
ncbi:MAG: hypothetical protein H0U29_08585 [Acidimicrobiia bacterium]|nr:hypothetical protein [Acidimicrobiia bacterium]